MFYVIKKQGSFLRFWGGRDEARKGGCVRAKSQDATDGRVISQKKSESLINMRKMEGKSSGNARFSGKLYFGHKKLDRNEYDSRRAFVVHSDTKLPKVENMERRPVIIKHRTQRCRMSRIAGRPARDVWKHELYETKGRQIIRKCEILKQMTREARKRIYHLGKLKGHPKSPDVSNGNAATSRTESRSVWR